jgi:hypothetical protein
VLADAFTFLQVRGAGQDERVDSGFRVLRERGGDILVRADQGGAGSDPQPGESGPVGRVRPGGGAAMTWCLRAEPGIEAWARDLAARENACCAFMTHTISDDHVLSHATTIDDPSARAVLDLFYELPARRWDTVDAVEERWQVLAVPILIRDGDRTRVATREEIRTGRIDTR